MQRMQHSSLVRFCDECGLANELEASHCAACQYPLASTSSTVSAPPKPVAPIVLVPTPVREVMPGPLFATDIQRAPRDFWPGMILNEHYQIQEEIGRGGFSIVYRAVEVGPRGREVAIKRIPLNALTPRQIIDATETFNREITMLARFKGTKGVPTFYEHLTDPENWYLVMEYINGQTLEEYLQQKPGGYLREGEVVQLGSSLAQIMQALHKDNPPVIFRDLKPANLMIMPNHELYLIDFGVARNFTFGKAKDTTRLGSPGYAPPEQYGRAQTDARSDIYSLGATLQTLLTGRDPLDLRSGEPSLNPKPTSPALRKLLDAMLSPDPLQRPVDMVHVQKSLESVPVQTAAQRISVASYILGLALGALLGGGLLMFLLIGTGASSFWMGYIPFMIVNAIWQRVRKKHNFPKASQRHVLYGVLTALVPFLLIWLLHTFG